MSHKISSRARRDSQIGLLLRVLFYIRFYIIPIYLYPSLYTLFNISVSFAVGGLYLGINFIISHNFEGVLNNTNNTNEDWAISQIESSSTVGGRVLGFFHGGLNYQIEHHLFPRISHVHYYKMKPIIQEWCKKNNVKYNYYNNLWDNIYSCYKYLELQGRETQKEL